MPQASSKHAYLSEIKLILDNQFKHNIKVDKLALDVGVSTSKLKHDFSLFFGISILDYRTRAKIHAAKQLLESNPESIKWIASRVGYKRVDSFSRSFKRFTGISPKQYRSSLLGETNNNRQSQSDDEQ